MCQYHPFRLARSSRRGDDDRVAGFGRNPAPKRCAGTVRIDHGSGPDSQEQPLPSNVGEALVDGKNCISGVPDCLYGVEKRRTAWQVERHEIRHGDLAQDQRR